MNQVTSLVPSQNLVHGRPATGRPPRIVIVGGGFVGFTLARTLERRLRRGEADVVLIDPSPSMTYQPFLVETAAGLIEPRHVSVPLRPTLRRTRVLTGRVMDVDTSRRQARVLLPDGTVQGVEYDELVLAPGSVPRPPNLPSLVEHALLFTGLSDAQRLRDTVLSRLALAADTPDVDTAREAQTFVVVGGGFSGVELVAELHRLAVASSRRSHHVARARLRFELIEAGPELLPELPSRLGAYARRRLERDGVAVRVDTRIVAADGPGLRLSDGAVLRAGTVVWTAGVRANPVLGRLGLPTDPHGRLRTRTTLQVQGASHVWAAGDGASVPDLAAAAATDADPRCAATAQHAVRQARVAAKNLLATLRGGDLIDYRHRDAGSVGTLGLHRGVARILGVPLRGLPAWLVHRAYHLAMIPTWSRKLRVALGWAAALLGRRDLGTPWPAPVAEPGGANPADRLEAGA